MEHADTMAIFGSVPFASHPSPITTATSVHSGVSPNSSAEDYEFDFPGEEDEGNALTDFFGDGSSDDKADKKRGRRPPSTAAKRATHNAVERARRESLNDRFMELSQVLPNMSMSKRPSKNSIVEHAIEWVGIAQRRDRAMAAENASLLAELNALRARAGMAPRPALEPIIEAPTGKPPSKRPSTIQNPIKVAAPKAVVKKDSVNADVSPRTASAPIMAPAVVDVPQPSQSAAPVLVNTMVPTQTGFAGYEWTAPQFVGGEVFAAFDPAAFGQAGPYVPMLAWQTPFAYVPTPMTTLA